ncbi:hypothetical protein FAVG1_02763 [Fusarium avenaceum]|nr:hypothetical protein FAVG1_02763 [Fusarium avenaceum]
MIQQATSPFPKEDSILDKLTDQATPADNTLLLADELSCAMLDTLHPHLDLISRKSSSHIDALHVHLRKRRAVTISEHARLHLVWHSDMVYLKPLPVCLLSSGFWELHLPPGSPTRPRALGFMRTYAYLIRHRSDFQIAQREDLIPQSERLLHGEFEAFIRHFRSIPDDQVSPRWEFGQLRLRWLDWAVRIFQPRVPGTQGPMLRRLFYEEPYQQTGQFLREFGAPLLFIFAGLSLILSAMQVILAARPDDPWPGFASVSAGFSVAIIILLVTIIFVLLVVVVVVLTLQLGFALRARRKRKNQALG